MNIKINMFTIILCLTAMLGWSFGMEKKASEGRGLFLYSGSEITKFLEKAGHSNFQPKSAFDLRRNSTGTELFFINTAENRVLIISCAGTIKEIEIPSNLIWIDDRYQALAWVDKKDWKVHYKHGQTEEPPFMADKRADPSGTYFMKIIESAEHKGLSDGTSIYSIENPQMPLATIMKFHGQRIFSKDSKVIVIGNYYDTRDEQSEIYIYERKDKALAQVEKEIVRRPHKSHASFAVADLNPWGDEILFIDVFDFPYRSVWYSYNMTTHEMKKLDKMPYGGGYGFYLQCDIIKTVR